MPRRMPKPWRMTPPRHWPLDLFRYGALAQAGAPCRREPASCPPSTPPAARAWRQSTHPARCAPAAGTAMATCAATARPRAGRPALILRTFPHHGLFLAARRVVDHRDERIALISTSPSGPPLGLVGSKIRARQWPRPVSNPKSPNRHAATFADTQVAALKASL